MGGSKKKLGNLCAFNETEAGHFEGIRDLIDRYLDLESPERPLCIGVFGPPGSGKSFSVKQIVSFVVGERNADKADEDKISMPPLRAAPKLPYFLDRRTPPA